MANSARALYNLVRRGLLVHKAVPGHKAQPGHKVLLVLKVQ